MRYVYLAGPITGCTGPEANDWRAEVAEKLRVLPDNWWGEIRGVSPLRCEPLLGERYNIAEQGADPLFGTSRAIASKNFFDVRTCDALLAFLPAHSLQHDPSYGTVGELAWAHALGKPTVLVSDYPKVLEHPVINACAGWVLSDLDQAVELLSGLLGGYIEGGKNV